MRILHLFIIIWLINTQGFAQSLIWEKSYGGTVIEYGNSMIKSNDSSFIIVGATNSRDGDVSGLHGFAYDQWLISIDSSGTLNSQKCLGGMNDDEATKIIKTIDGGYAIAGYTNSFDGDVTGGGYHANEDFWIVKLDSSFNIQWQKCIGSYATDKAYSIKQCQDSGFIVIGTVGNSGGDVIVWHGNTDIFVVKLSSTGNKQWVKTIGGSSFDEGRDCYQTNDGGFLILGYGSSYDGDLLPNHLGSIYVFKLSNLGSILWSKTYGGSGVEEASQFINDEYGNTTIIGTTNSDDGDVTGHINGPDVWVLKIDSIGRLIWQNCYGTNGFEGGKCIGATSDGGYIIGASSLFGDSTIVNYGYYDCWIIKIDSIGRYQWSKIVGGSQWDEVNSILEISEHEYIFAATTSSSDFDVAFNHSQGDEMWVGKLTDIQLNTNNELVKNKDFSVNYNGSELIIRFISEHSKNSTLKIYNLMGKELYSQGLYLNLGLNVKTFSLDLPLGVNFIVIEDPENYLKYKFMNTH